MPTQKYNCDALGVTKVMIDDKYFLMVHDTLETPDKYWGMIYQLGESVGMDLPSSPDVFAVNGFNDMLFPDEMSQLGFDDFNFDDDFDFDDDDDDDNGGGSGVLV